MEETISTTMIHGQNLRKKHTSSNPGPKNQFITQRDHHGWKIKEPYLEKLA
jgi:hypothetical protein